MDVHMHRQAIAMPTQQQSLIKEETQILTCAEATKNKIDAIHIETYSTSRESNPR